MTSGVGPIFYFNNASTTDNRVVSRAITGDPRLERIAELSVVYPNYNSYSLDLYRESGAVPGQYSRDFYGWDGSGWQPAGKDSRKYAHHELPWPPPGSVEETVSNVRVWTRSEMNDDARVLFTSLIDVLPRP